MSVIMEQEENMLYLEINRPEKANSLNPPILMALRENILSLQNDDTVDVVILTGAGKKDFTTGIDVISVMSFPQEGIKNVARIAGDIATLLFSGKPSVVACNGRTMGMGVVFSAAADYSICVRDAVFQLPEIDIPVFPGASCIPLLARKCGISCMKKILLLGQPLDSFAALNARLVDEIVDDSVALKRRASEIAEILAEKDPVAVKSIKLAANSAPDLKYGDTLELEDQLALFYDWEDPLDQFDSISRTFRVDFPLTGDVTLLKKDHEESLR